MAAILISYLWIILSIAAICLWTVIHIKTDSSQPCLIDCNTYKDYWILLYVLHVPYTNINNQGWGTYGILTN